jgi:hypothetical protein
MARQNTHDTRQAGCGRDHQQLDAAALIATTPPQSLSLSNRPSSNGTDEQLSVFRTYSMGSFDGAASSVACSDACTCPAGGAADGCHLGAAAGCGKIRSIGASTCISSAGNSRRSSESGDEEGSMSGGGSGCGLLAGDAAGPVVVGGAGSLLADKSAEFIMFNWKVMDCLLEGEHDW